ncbi:MAG: protein PhnA [Chlamydiales bacterium]|jgi:protein PhnA
MEDLPKCEKCSSEYTYEDGTMYICPDCAHEWAKESEEEETEERAVKDAFGNILKDGDSVTVIKDLKVKGSASGLKAGLKVKGIRLVDEVNGHDIECKIKGVGAMMLKSSVVKKCS